MRVTCSLVRSDRPATYSACTEVAELVQSRKKPSATYLFIPHCPYIDGLRAVIGGGTSWQRLLEFD
jgi:hypothetical protein